MGEVVRRARRDPERRARIREAAAELIATRGYHAVGVADIGVAAGIVGSGVYRHFESKSALLAVLLKDVMDGLVRDAAAIADVGSDDRETVSALVSNHIRVAVEQRRVLQVYFRELPSLPEPDQRRLRQSQRHYIEEWVAVLAPLRRDLADAELRLTVHAAIGVIQSILFHDIGLPTARLRGLVEEMAHACLGLSADQPSPVRSLAAEAPRSESSSLNSCVRPKLPRC
ncbi:MAG: TetR/AcrR family transcriptional regulator [Pseudonocardia sp.]|nr:TetR/AcrR family transcriptional regulator [Pseudonocardia sp.]